jgi:hypothetical protein
MPCPVCSQPVGEADHRHCVLALLKSGQITSADEWTRLASDKPVTIYKGRIRALIPKEKKP